MANDSTASYRREQYLEEVLADYLEAARAGRAPERRELLARHPELAAELAEFLADHDLLYDLAEPLRLDAAVRTPSPSEDTVTVPSSDLSRRFGDYERLELIATSGMGVVYRARQVSLDRIVALKMVRPGGREPDDLERFLHIEARAVAGLDHPHIVPIYDFGTCEGQPFFSMKLIDGGDLARRLRAEPRLSQREAARLLATIARAVHHAHQRGILHRDLKPSNILLDKDGQPHVADFGLAKRVQGDSAATDSGSITGTPSYMAPEQAAASPVLTTAVDVYGLGAILYELLTGRPPFRADSPLDTILQARTQEPPRPRSLNAQADRDLETICLKCLERDPARRYGSAEALADDLERWLRGEPIVARPASAWEQLAKWAKRRPAVSVLLSVAATLVMAMLGLSVWGWQQSADKAKAEGKARIAAEEKVIAEKQRAEEAGQRVHAVKAHLALERGCNRLDRGEIGPGLLWLARGLEEVPDDEGDLRASLRRLVGGYRNELAVPRAVLPEQGIVTSVAFDLDGKTFAATRWTPKESFVQRWDARTLKPVGNAVSYRNAPMQVFSPDGRKLMLLGNDARILDLQSGKFMGEPFAPRPTGEAILAGAISPEGNSVALCPAQAPVSVWDVNTRKRRFDLHAKGYDGKSSTVGVVFSSDGKSLITAGDFGIRRWNAETGELVGEPLLRPGSLAIGKGEMFTASADGKKLVFYFPKENEAVFLHVHADQPNILIAKPVRVPGGELNNLNNLTLSRDGSYLALTYGGNRIAVWDWRSPRPELVDKSLLHVGPEQQMFPATAFSPDNKTLITANGTCLVWDVPAAPPYQRFGTGRVENVAISPDGKTLIAMCESAGDKAEIGAQRWNIATGKALGEPLRHNGHGVSSLAFSPDGKTLATGSKADASVRCWDAATGRPLGERLPHPSSIKALAFSADGQALLTVGHLQDTHSLFRRWDVSTGRLQDDRPLRDRFWQDMNVSPRGTYYLSVNNKHPQDGPSTLELWDSVTGKPVGTPIQQRRPVWGVAFSPDEKTLLTVSGGRAAPRFEVEGEVRLWDTATGRPRGEPASCSGLQELESGPRVGFTSDGKSFATFLGSKIQFWDTNTVRRIGPPQPLPDSHFHGEVHFALAFDPRGETVAVATAQRGVFLLAAPRPVEQDAVRIRLWIELATWKELDAGGAVVDLDDKTWRERWQQLQKLGGPP